MEIATRDSGRNHVRELTVDGRVVSWLTLIDYGMRIGSSVVRMAGIAGVGTLEEERMKGYSRAVLEDTVRYMEAERYDVSMLFGIRDYYQRFGYASCIPVVRVRMATRDAEAAGADAHGFGFREYRDGDVEAIMGLYNAENQARTGTLVRLPEFFSGIHRGSEWGRRADPRIIEDEAGGLIGYMALDKSQTEVVVTEVGCLDPGAYPTVLAEIARTAIERRCGDFLMCLPVDHPFTQFCQRYECLLAVQYLKCSSGMMRVVSQQSLFTKLIPELQRRASQSSLAPMTLDVRTDVGRTVVDVAHGTVNGSASGLTIEMPQSKLMQLMVGYRSIGDLRHDSDVRIDCDAVPFVDVLFPPCTPYVWEADHF